MIGGVHFVAATLTEVVLKPLGRVLARVDFVRVRLRSNEQSTGT